MESYGSPLSDGKDQKIFFSSCEASDFRGRSQTDFLHDLRARPIRKLQRLQDLVTHGQTRTDRGIGDSRRLDYASRNTSCLYLPLRKGNKLQLSSLLMTNSDKSHIFRLASEISGREGGRPVTDKGTIKNLPKPTNQLKMRKTYQYQNEENLPKSV